MPIYTRKIINKHGKEVSVPLSSPIKDYRQEFYAQQDHDNGEHTDPRKNPECPACRHQVRVEASELNKNNFSWMR